MAGSSKNSLYRSMKKWSKSWIKSKNPKKQRKYVFNAPLNIKHKFLSSHLSKDLREKYKKRSFTIRKGDKVKISQGQFKNLMGKVEKVILKKTRVYVEGAQLQKKDGSKAYYPIHPSNLIIIELNLDDKERKKALERK